MKPQFTSYTAQALAADDAFIGWVLQGRDDAAWQQWLRDFPEAEPRVAQARSLVLSLSEATAQRPAQEDLDSLWHRIEASVEAHAKPKTIVRPLWIRLWPVAAAAVIALLIWFAVPGGTQKIIAEAGRQETLQLPEESSVVLNAGSRVVYGRRTFARDRSLRLDGEAFFRVKPGSTFIVETPYGQVTVLGTSFNVFARDGKLEVECYTGKVRVTDIDGASVVIEPGQRAVAEDGQVSQSVFVADAAKPEWTDGRFRFENAPLREVIDELERQYDVRVDYTTSIGELTYTGLFERGDLDNALQLITWPLHITYVRDGRTIRLSQ
jgi:ferric-dicitrate binding protein FerR (iron transport regulator)